MTAQAPGDADIGTHCAPLKIVLLAPASVIHTQRWVDGLQAGGIELVLVTQHPNDDWKAPAGVRIVTLPFTGSAGYFLNVPALRRVLREARPDLLHAHYASGYGTTAAFAGFRPWLLSVWGSDVYDFPTEGRLQRWLLRRNLRHADRIASTSEAMASHVDRLIAPRAPVFVTPFGIDTTRFASVQDAHKGFVVGTVKTLALKYGIDVLLYGYAEFVGLLTPAERAASMLVIVGEGPQRDELIALADQLGIASQTHLIGRVPHADVPRWLNGFDVYVAASRLDSESFGVAVLEASACGVAVVVSDAGGLPEVVVDGVTGLVVPREDAAALARALRRLFDAPLLREQLGAAGRRRVVAHYDWLVCVERMIACYRALAGRGTPAASTTAATRSVTTSSTASVIVPCRNELGYIEAFCHALWRQRLPAGWSLQVVIADGGSDDGTTERLREMAALEPRLQVIDNPSRIVSAGLNRALERVTGEVVVRMDVHTEYADDYIAQCLQALAATGADNVGGPWHAEPVAGAGPTQRAVAAAFQSRWVAGGALSRQLDHSGWVDTVYLGCWPRASFERFGGFDESLVRNQDDEHNLRISRGGGRVWQSARIRSVYRPRAALAQVFRQYLQYGYWKPFVMKKHGQSAALRHWVPAGFVAGLGVTALAALAGMSAWPLGALVGLYGCAVLAMTAGVVAAGTLDARAAARVPLVIVAYHLSYGIGSWLGLWDVLRHGHGRARFGALTR